MRPSQTANIPSFYNTIIFALHANELSKSYHLRMTSGL